MQTAKMQSEAATIQERHDNESCSLNIPGPEDGAISIRDNNLIGLVGTFSNDPHDTSTVNGNYPNVADTHKSAGAHKERVPTPEESDGDSVYDQRAWWKLEQNGFFEMSDLQPENADHTVLCKQR